MSSAQTPRNIGFIGLGAMGFWMAKNLRSKLPESARLHIHDVNKEVLEKFHTTYGSLRTIIVCGSSEEVVAKSDCIISIVPEGKHVTAVYSSSPGGALANPDISGKLVLECSTIDMETSQRVSAEVMRRGAIFVDAPVSGGPAGAENGTLTFMMGLDAAHPHLERIKTILGMMGKNLFECGGPTLGLATKICNNYISGTIAIATSEGYNLAIRLGLNPKTFQQVLAVSTGGSWVNSNCNPVPGVDPKAPASNDYAPGFKVQFMRKDYDLAIRAAEQCGAQLYLGPPGLQVYTEAAAHPDCVDRDSRVVYRFIGGPEKWS